MPADIHKTPRRRVQADVVLVELPGFPLTLDLEAWNAGTSVLILGCVVALVAYAVRTSVLAQPAPNR